MIKQPLTSQYEYNRSKFLGFVYHVETLTEVKEICNRLQTEYQDAHQFCYAYRLHEPTHERFNDDSEPLHSAGYVAYQLMLKQDVTNALIVMIRYKSGPNLGLNHLKRSYLACAKPLLVDNLIPFEQLTTYNFNTAYSHTNAVLHFCQVHHIKVISQDYTMEGTNYIVELSETTLTTLIDFLKSLQ